MRIYLKCPGSAIPLPFFRCRFAVAVAATVAYLFAVYGCNGTEFSYVIFTEQRRNGNGRTATEWWKPGKRLEVRNVYVVYNWLAVPGILDAFPAPRTC